MPLNLRGLYGLYYILVYGCMGIIALFVLFCVRILIGPLPIEIFLTKDYFVMRNMFLPWVLRKLLEFSCITEAFS